MDVAITELRAHLGDWIDRARAGEQIVVTDRGLPVARLSGLESTSLMERLIAEGVVSPARAARRPAAEHVRVKARGSISDIVSEQRAQR